MLIIYSQFVLHAREESRKESKRNKKIKQTQTHHRHLSSPQQAESCAESHGAIACCSLIGGMRLTVASDAPSRFRPRPPILAARRRLSPPAPIHGAFCPDLGGAAREQRKLLHQCAFPWDLVGIFIIKKKEFFCSVSRLYAITSGTTDANWILWCWIVK